MTLFGLRSQPMAIHPEAQLLIRRRTRIVATVGPASLALGVPERLIAAGVNVFRLNMSHGDHETHRAAYERLRAAAAGRPVAILADLSGPKIRTRRFEGGSIPLVEGETVTVTTRDVLGEPGLIPSAYPALADDVRPGERILLDDGRLELQVRAVDGTEISCRVLVGGELRDRKGMNLPGVAVSAPSLTEKDRRDALFALRLGVDFLALSFVRRAADVQELRDLVQEAGCEAAIIAKIEKPEALDDIEAILDVAYAIMVARGDLGVELPLEQVPVVQDQLVCRARQKGRPVIVATQMLESMIEEARPTRAEVADISHAVGSGADALMLSAETAVGRHPVEAVEVMDRVARQAEAYLWQQGAFASLTADDETPLADALPDPSSGPGLLQEAVARATAKMSRDLKVRSIVVVARSGAWARLISSERPAAPVLAITARDAAFHRLCLSWGTLPVRVEPRELEDPQALAGRILREQKLAEAGKQVLLVRGYHLHETEDTPSLAVLTL